MLHSYNEWSAGCQVSSSTILFGKVEQTKTNIFCVQNWGRNQYSNPSRIFIHHIKNNESILMRNQQLCVKHDDITKSDSYFVNVIM